MVVVDHIKRRQDGGTDTFDNFQSLCSHHHDVKRAEEKNEKYKK